MDAKPFKLTAFIDIFAGSGGITMGVKAQAVQKPPGLSDCEQSQFAGSSQKRRHAPGPTDARQCPNQSPLSPTITAPTDIANLAPFDQSEVEIYPTPMANDKPDSISVPFSPWLSIRSGERYCHVRDGVLRAAIKRGEVPAYKREGGKGVIVHMHDLDAWIRSWGAAKGAYA